MRKQVIAAALALFGLSLAACSGSTEPPVIESTPSIATTGDLAVVPDDTVVINAFAKEMVDYVSTDAEGNKTCASSTEPTIVKIGEYETLSGTDVHLMSRGDPGSDLIITYVADGGPRFYSVIVDGKFALPVPFIGVERLLVVLPSGQFGSVASVTLCGSGGM